MVDSKAKIYKAAYIVKLQSEKIMMDKIAEFVDDIKQICMDSDRDIENIFMDTDAFDDEFNTQED